MQQKRLTKNETKNQILHFTLAVLTLFPLSRFFQQISAFVGYMLIHF